MLSGSFEMVAESNSNLHEYKCKIGTRIECSGSIGTVKYIGPVEGYPGSWLGVDWHDSERGKHNGTHNGVQYFTATHPKSGSFVRPEKVNFGQSAVESIVGRYGEVEDELTAKINEQERRMIQQSIKAPFIELVGFDKVADKQSDYRSLQVVNLRLQNVSSPGEPLELKQLCPHIRELDLSKNLLSEWFDVFEICSQLEFLTWLNVSENLLNFPENCQSILFPNLRTIICGSMNLLWEDILKISAVFPNIQELRVQYNNIKTLTTPAENNFQSLKILDLEGNKIINWNEVIKLCVIPTLRQMNLENIELESIEFQGTEQNVDIFTNLKKFNINNNLLNNWKSISQLNRLQNLEELRLLNNPILETENILTREQLVIARIANLKVLNGRYLKPEDRRGAEYDYIKKYGLEWLKVKDTEGRLNFLEEHNRYLELIERFGAPEESELVVQPNIISTSLISLNLIHGERTVSKKLPPTFLVQKLILLVQKLFSLEERPGLTYVSSSDSDIEITLDDEMKEIGYYSVKDGDKIIVSI